MKQNDIFFHPRGESLYVDDLDAFPALQPHQRGAFIKLGLRRAQAISVVNATAVLTFAPGAPENPQSQPVLSAVITLGAVAPTIIHAVSAEAYLPGKVLSEGAITQAAGLAMQDSHPIDDVRGSAAYKRALLRRLLFAAFLELFPDRVHAGDLP